jgi:hypothetical protein
MRRRFWQILWRLAASVLIIVVAEWLLDLLATQLGIIAPVDTTAAIKLVTFFLGGVVLVASIFCVVWMWAPYIRPPAKTPDGF